MTRNKLGRTGIVVFLDQFKLAEGARCRIIVFVIT
jgi:hypothetical protein